MNLTDFNGLIDRATFFYERLAETWQPTSHPFDQGLVERRLARWCQLTAGGDWDRFAHRLAWDGLDLAAVRPFLGAGNRAPNTPLPDWGHFLAHVIETAADQPVAEIAQSFVQAAQARLGQRVGPQLAWLAPSAQRSLTLYLSERLVSLAQTTLTEGHPQTVAAHCLRYPVLARQLAQRSLDWVAEVADFLVRLAADWPALAQHVDLPHSATAGIARDLRPGFSDPHGGGRTVWRVELGEGALAYKPKSLQMDQSWAEWVQWTSANGFEFAPASLWVVTRQGYGWMEWAQPDPISNAQRFAQNVGGMLALLHLVHAADCHAENLLVRGNSPLLLDAEMLVYPQFIGHEDADPLDVLRTGLLPRWLADGSAQDGVRTLFGESVEIPLAQVTEGYHSACDWLAGAWPILDGEDGALARLRRGQVRIAPRPTAAYLRLLDHLRHPAFLTDGIDFSIETDRLAHTYLHRPGQERFAPLLAAEHQAVNQGDVPLFHTEIDHPDLPGFLQPGRSLLPILRWPMFSLPSPADKVRQVALIHASLDRSSYAVAMPQTFIAAARHLGEQLARRAIQMGGARVITWIAVQYQPRSGLWQHGLLGEDLYAGRAGIALFLAALAHVTGEARWQELALAGFAEDDSAGGAAVDWGGRIYALSVAAQLLGEPTLLKQAEQMAQRLPPVGSLGEVTTHPWGVLDGEAGIVLALLGLHAQTAEDWTLSLAAARGQEILRAAPAWTHSDYSLGGFSHGAAGIAYALCRLYRASGDNQFLAGAVQAWEFQQRLFSDPPANWQDRRGPTPVYLRNWCNGAGGIGLAAAACADDLPRLRPWVERAAELLIADPSSDLDTLCCGQFGQIESLLEMGLLQNRQDWIEQASAQARQVLSYSAESGAFHLYDDLPDHLFNPGFFRGVAGIGYTLLRLAAANGEGVGELPCVMRNE